MVVSLEGMSSSVGPSSVAARRSGATALELRDAAGPELRGVAARLGRVGALRRRSPNQLGGAGALRRRPEHCGSASSELDWLCSNSIEFYRS